MTKELVIIAIIIVGLVYYYHRKQQQVVLGSNQLISELTTERDKIKKKVRIMEFFNLVTP